MTGLRELRQLRKHYSHWPKRVFHRLSIRQKIFCGYSLALGIAVLGTAAGLVVGDRYFQQARRQMILADEEGNLLSNFQGALLEIQTHQQEFVPFLRERREFIGETTELMAHLKEAENLLSQLQEFSQSTSNGDLQALLKKHDSNLKEYLQQFRVLVQQISPLTSKPEKVTKAQQLISQFNQSQVALEFYKFSHELTDFAKTVRERQNQADAAQRQADIMEVQIIVGSMLLSVAIASILAIYISRIITRPIHAVRNVALRVTKEANFDLQAPVNTTDEIGALATSLNQLIQQVKHLLEEQQAEAQARLIQSEKMCSLGQMLAGVAHEINNPVNYISGNLVHIKNYIEDLLTLLQTYKTEINNPPAAVQIIAEEIDLEFLKVDLPKLINSMAFGAERTREIARSLKDFSRLDGGEMQIVDIHACIESTLLILNNRLKNGITIIRNYKEIPAIAGYTGLLYQVFMNLLSNAIDALEQKYNDSQKTEFSPEITIATEHLDNWVTVRIADNGSGISPENIQKIFETFFTTKPRGIGTGLGLAISHQIVVEKHDGKITCQSQLDKGTEFVITLPTASR
ncbi:MAG: ATP-binding protein [Heteroscytonema crispum UTEX LB 1556]